MQRIKLTEAGSSIVRQVEWVGEVTTGKWPDYEIVSGDEVIIIPKSAADRQLARMKMTSMAELEGEWVKVSRSDEPGDNGKLFWNLTVVPAPTPGPPKRLTAAQAAHAPPHTGPLMPFDEPTEDEELAAGVAEDADGRMGETGFAAFSTAVESVRKPVDLAKAKRHAAFHAYVGLFGEMDKALGVAYKMKVAPEVVQAATATVWISWKDRGISP